MEAFVSVSDAPTVWKAPPDTLDDTNAFATFFPTILIPKKKYTTKKDCQTMFNLRAAISNENGIRTTYRINAEFKKLVNSLGGT